MQFFNGGQLELSAELAPVGGPECLERCPTLLFKAPLLERLLRLFFWPLDFFSETVGGLLTDICVTGLGSNPVEGGDTTADMLSAACLLKIGSASTSISTLRLLVPGSWITLLWGTMATAVFCKLGCAEEMSDLDNGSVGSVTLICLWLLLLLPLSIKNESDLWNFWIAFWLYFSRMSTFFKIQGFR